MGGGAGADRLHRLLEVGRREPRRRRSSTIMCWPRSRRSTRSARRSASKACTRSAIASPGRCWPRRWRCSPARGEADKVASATFFTAQVDFSEAGDLKLFIGDEQMELIRQLSADKGYLDGRYMAATFNLLRGPRPDLVLRHQQLPARRGLSAVRPAPLERRHHQPAGGLAPRLSAAALPGEQTGPARRDDVDGTPIDLRLVKTPSYVQAGREDHIAPAQSVWKITHHFTGPLRFVLAGSGHIAGVVNPPEARQISILDQRGEGGHARAVRRRRHRDQGQLVAGLDAAGSGAFPTRRCRRRACASRARAGSRRSRMRRGAM